MTMTTNDEPTPPIGDDDLPDGDPVDILDAWEQACQTIIDTDPCDSESAARLYTLIQRGFEQGAHAMYELLAERIASAETKEELVGYLVRVEDDLKALT